MYRRHQNEGRFLLNVGLRAILMPGFHHSVAVLPLPFRRSAVIKFRCSNELWSFMLISSAFYIF